MRCSVDLSAIAEFLVLQDLSMTWSYSFSLCVFYENNKQYCLLTKYLTYLTRTRKIQLRALKISAFLEVGSMTNDPDYLTRPESCRKAVDKSTLLPFSWPQYQQLLEQSVRMLEL